MTKAEYSNYLKSDHWQDVRKRFYASGLYNGQCECCFNKNVPLQIHHRSYKRLGRERLNDLMALCADCHKKTHEFVRKGRRGHRVSLWSAAKFTRRAVAKDFTRRMHKEMNAVWRNSRSQSSFTAA